MAEIKVFEDQMVCAELIYVEGEIPFERLFFGNVESLSEILSGDFLKKKALEQNAKTAYIQNLYVRAKTKNGKERMEFRIGNNGDTDMEAFTYKED